MKPPSLLLVIALLSNSLTNGLHIRCNDSWNRVSRQASHAEAKDSIPKKDSLAPGNCVFAEQNILDKIIVTNSIDRILEPSIENPNIYLIPSIGPRYEIAKNTMVGTSLNHNLDPEYVSENTITFCSSINCVSFPHHVSYFQLKINNLACSMTSKLILGTLENTQLLCIEPLALPSFSPETYFFPPTSNLRSLIYISPKQTKFLLNLQFTYPTSPQDPIKGLHTPTSFIYSSEIPLSDASLTPSLSIHNDGESPYNFSIAIYNASKYLALSDFTIETANRPLLPRDPSWLLQVAMDFDTYDVYKATTSSSLRIVSSRLNVPEKLLIRFEFPSLLSAHDRAKDLGLDLRNIIYSPPPADNAKFTFLSQEPVRSPPIRTTPEVGDNNEATNDHCDVEKSCRGKALSVIVEMKGESGSFETEGAVESNQEASLVRLEQLVKTMENLMRTRSQEVEQRSPDSSHSAANKIDKIENGLNELNMTVQNLLKEMQRQMEGVERKIGALSAVMEGMGKSAVASDEKVGTDRRGGGDGKAGSELSWIIMTLGGLGCVSLLVVVVVVTMERRKKKKMEETERMEEMMVTF